MNTIRMNPADAIYRKNTQKEMACLQEGFTDITYARDGYIYYIENSENECGSRTINGHFFSLGDAVDEVKKCCDWYRSNGTGRIYRVEPGAHKYPTLVWRN